MIEFKRVRESDLEIIMNWRSSRKISKYLITEVSRDMDQQKKNGSMKKLEINFLQNTG